MRARCCHGANVRSRCAGTTRVRGRRVVVGVGDTGGRSVIPDTLTAPNPPGIPVAGGSLPVTLPR
jgi:hypothetical protein